MGTCPVSSLVAGCFVVVAAAATRCCRHQTSVWLLPSDRKYNSSQQELWETANMTIDLYNDDFSRLADEDVFKAIEAFTRREQWRGRNCLLGAYFQPVLKRDEYSQFLPFSRQMGHKKGHSDGRT